MKIYLNGTSGIKKPVDHDGNEIQCGDFLTYDYLDPFFQDRDMSEHENKPVYEVKKHKSGLGFFGSGLKSELYIHDFRFKYCRIIKK